MRYLLLLLAFLAVPYPAAGQPYRQVRGVIHMDSSISGGEYGPEELVRFLLKNGLHVAVITDHDTVRWDYGIFPVRWIMGWFTGWLIGKASGRTGSVQEYGPARYLHLMDALNEKYNDIVVIPGVEAIPFFYWKGSLFNGTLTMVDGFKHLLVFGMKTPQDYAGIPSVGHGFYRGYGIQSFLSLWPLVLILFGYKCWKRARQGAFFRIPAFLFLAVGFLFLLNNFPFKFGRYDQYHGEQGIGPYQDVIDYAVNRGGLVFWAHPEVAVDQTVHIGAFTAHIHTAPYYRDLLYARRYTGFSAFEAGIKYTIPPGGIWDQVLAQYCLGLRKKPVWAIGEGDVEGPAFSPKLSQTVFLVRSLNRPEILQSLREGRIYAVCGPLADSLRLETLALSDTKSSAGMGQALRTDQKEIRFTATITCAPSPKGDALRADLIRDGKVVDTYRAEGTLKIDRRDEVPPDGRLHYYRLDVRAPAQSRLLTNPVFVRLDRAS